MKTIFSNMGATALLASVASAAPLNPTAAGTPDRHFSAASSFQIGRIARPAKGIERQARAGLAAVAFHF